MGHDLDAVVWVADDVVFDGLDYGSRLVERLAARDWRVAREDLTRADGHVPAAALHVLSGGGTSVSDRSGWMRGGLALTRELVDRADRGEHTVLGVCLGAQMLAETLWPGSVRASPRIEVGLTEVVWRVGGDRRFVVPAFHHEQVERSYAAGDGAEVVAENAQAGLQGFRSRDRIWGVQFHPELAPADVRRLVAHHRQAIEAHHGHVAAALQSVEELEPAWRAEVFDLILDHVTTHGR